MGISYEVRTGSAGGGGGGDIPIEGYGKNVTGGTGKTVYTVTNENGTGSGSLEYIISNNHSDMIIQFDASVNVGKISSTDSWINSNVTIDGFANGHTNGVRIEYGSAYSKGALVLQGLRGGAGNIWIKGINFRGPALDDNNPTWAEDDLIRIDGSEGSGNYAGTLDGILIERCTFYRSGDGCCDITNDSGQPTSWIRNLTIQQCMFTDTGLTQLIKYPQTERLSIHHCVYVHNGERNPQIRGNLGLLDYVNNIIFQNGSDAGYPADYHMHYSQGNLSPYGLRIWCANTAPTGNPTVNVRGCAFLGDLAGTGIIVDSGQSDANCYFDPQGSGASNNYWDPTGAIDPSPKATPNDTSGYSITRHTVAELVDLLPQIGCPLRVGTDQQRLDDIATYWPL